MVQDQPLTREDIIKKEFLVEAKTKLTDPECVSKCITLCSIHSVTPNELANKWEAHAIKHNLTSVTAKELDKFSSTLATKKQDQFKKKDNRKQQKVLGKGNVDELVDIYSAYDVTVNNSEFQNDMDVDEAFEIKSDVVVVPKPEPEQEWISRSDRGKVEFSFNDHLELNPELDDEVEVQIDFDTEINQMSPYPFMNDKIANKSEVLEEKLDDLTEAIVKHNKLPEPSVFHIPNQEDLVAVGRICCEVEGKLNDVSVVLESTRANGKVRIRMLLKDTEEYSIFPGQAVAVEAANPSGRLVMVKKLYEGVPLPFQENSELQVPLSVVVASGPWTTDNLSFAPLDDFLGEMKKDSPDVVILIGPFVDANHPTIKNFELDCSFDDYFKKHVSEKLSKINIESKIILVPSLRDAQHDYYVFPQPPFSRQELDINNSIYLAPNPATININGVTIGISSNDIIKNLSGEETSKSKTDATSDRFSKLCEHLIAQRSYYPLFPPALGAQVDYTHFKQFNFAYTPDVLIVPSDVKHFVKNVKDVLCINPGRVVKGIKTAGTYARFTVYPKGDSDKNRVANRTRVDVVRL